MTAFDRTPTNNPGVHTNNRQQDKETDHNEKSDNRRTDPLGIDEKSEEERSNSIT